MPSAHDPAATWGGSVNDGISPGGSPQPNPPRAKRRRVEDEARVVFAPHLPDEILHLIFSRVAVDPRGGMPAVLAARGACRSWRRAASSPALWRDIALKRWGFCADTRGTEDADADRALCLRLARAREAPASYARGRWQRAVAAARAFRVAFCDAREARRDERRRAATLARRSNGRARGETTAPMYVTRDPPLDAEAATATGHALGLEPPFWRAAPMSHERDDPARCRERAPKPGVTDRLDADEIARTALSVHRVRAEGAAGAAEARAVVVTDHAVVLHVRDVPWARIARNLSCGLACVAVDVEVSDDEAEAGETEMDAGAASGEAPTRPKPRRARWVRVCQLWARVGVTLMRCGATRSDARLILDGHARFSHAAPSRYSRELFGDGDDHKRNLRTGCRPEMPVLGDEPDDAADRELEEFRYLLMAYRGLSDDYHKLSLRKSKADAVESIEDYRQCATLREIAPLQVAHDAKMAENDAREDVEGAGFVASTLVALASEFVCAVSFTSDEELDALFYADAKEPDARTGGVTFAPAVVTATLAVPRTFHGSPLATFRVGDGAAAAAARALERVTPANRAGLKCYLSFTHKSGVGYVYATALRPDAAAPEDPAAADRRARRGASRSPRAVHFSERHRQDAPRGTSGVFSAGELEAANRLDDDADDEISVDEDIDDALEIRRWEGGADGWSVTADVDPGPIGRGNFAVSSPYDANPHPAALFKAQAPHILPRRHVNWTREPRDDARLRGYFSSCGFDTAPDIDRVETPRMIQVHEASVSVGHSLLITVPLSALVAASGRAPPRKTRRGTVGPRRFRDAEPENGTESER